MTPPSDPLGTKGAEPDMVITDAPEVETSTTEETDDIDRDTVPSNNTQPNAPQSLVSTSA